MHIFLGILAILVIILLFKFYRSYDSAQFKGAVMVVETSRQPGLFGSQRILGYSQGLESRFTVANIWLGKTIEQHGPQLKIALMGDWERVDENTIRGTLIAIRSREGARVVREFKIGQEFPITTVSQAILNSDTNQARVMQLYLPEDTSID